MIFRKEKSVSSQELTAKLTPIIEKLKVASFEERMGGHIRGIGELSGEIMTDQVNDLFARPKRAGSTHEVDANGHLLLAGVEVS
jgi:hypothetical protein